MLVRVSLLALFGLRCPLSTWCKCVIKLIAFDSRLITKEFLFAQIFVIHFAFFAFRVQKRCSGVEDRWDSNLHDKAAREIKCPSVECVWENKKTWTGITGRLVSCEIEFCGSVGCLITTGDRRVLSTNHRTLFQFQQPASVFDEKSSNCLTTCESDWHRKCAFER